MTEAKTGNRVKVHYTGRLTDGTIFDSSENGGECAEECDCTHEPLEFVIGEGMLLPKFEAAVVGLKKGERVKVDIEAKEGYGERQEQLVAVISRKDIPADINPNCGDQMEVMLQDGSPLPVTVVAADAENITLDANHPLAGQDLNFDIKLVEIVA